jgi:tellurite resistance protein TerC
MGESLLWIVFGVTFVVALVLDLFVFQHHAHFIPIKESLKLLSFYVALALGFALLVYFVISPSKAAEFISGYIVEYSLSVDNLFVFLAIFTYFAVPREAERKALLWGILGAILLRGVFIFAGLSLINHFHFLLYLLGAILLLTAYRLATQKDREIEPGNNPFVRLARRFLRMSPEYDDAKFFTWKDGLRYATPLLIVVVAIETMDVLFATDSVPAVFAVSQDPLIVYTSNIFAILGLRALFFALAGLFPYFCYLSYGLSVVLGFVGLKMILIDLVHIPTWVSLVVIAGILTFSILLSVVRPKKKDEK